MFALELASKVAVRGHALLLVKHDKVDAVHARHQCGFSLADHPSDLSFRVMLPDSMNYCSGVAGVTNGRQAQQADGAWRRQISLELS